MVSCKERKSRFLLPGKAQNKTAAASGKALLPCLRELPHLAVPTDALGGKAFPAGTEAGFPGVLTYLSAHSLLQVQPALGEWEADLGVLAGALFPALFFFTV